MNPLAVAAAIAVQKIYKEEGIYESVRKIEGYYADMAHALGDEDVITDVRNIGLMCGFTFAQKDGVPMSRSGAIFLQAYENGLKIRVTGDQVAIAPPLTVKKNDIDKIGDLMRQTIKDVG